MPKHSAGLLMFRHAGEVIEVFLVHPGGPLWAKKDLGAWSIPKGEIEPAEAPIACAQREFEEEIGMKAHGEFISLGEIRQAGGKVVYAWAFEGDCDPSIVRSNSFLMVWPPQSGRVQNFPEIDRAEWFSVEHAGSRIIQGQIPFLDRLTLAIERPAKS